MKLLLVFFIILYSFAFMNNTTASDTNPETNHPVPHKPEQKDHEVVFDNPWFKVKKNKNFIYGERKGTDSIAFILLANNIEDSKRVGVVHEYKDPIDRFSTTAFGGSIDKPEFNGDLRNLVIEEVQEEAGFKVGLGSIIYAGKVLCSTQMNQFVHLFAVKVDKAKQGERTTTNPTELKGHVEWKTNEEAINLNDWKTATILAKILVNRKTHIIPEVKPSTSNSEKEPGIHVDINYPI